eukprot:4081682-Amphidinium_carterae.1
MSTSAKFSIPITQLASACSQHVEASSHDARCLLGHTAQAISSYGCGSAHSCGAIAELALSLSLLS